MAKSHKNHFVSTFLSHIKMQDNPWLLDLSAHEASRIFAAYAIYLALGHTLHYKTIMSATIRSYLCLAATYVANGCKRFQASHPHQPLAWLHPLHDPYEASYHWYRQITIVCDEVAWWEKLPDLKEPVTVAMVEDLCHQQDPLAPFGTATIIYDWTVIGMYTGHRLSEWAQHDHVTTLAKVALNDDGDPIAFTIHDIVFYGHGRCHTHS